MEIEVKDTETKILYATVQLLEEGGINNATTRRIADKAHVSEVTIFRKFKNKDNLLNEASKFYSEYFLNKLDYVFEIDEDEDLVSILKSLWNNILYLFEDDLNLIKISIEDMRTVSLGDSTFKKISEKVINNLKIILEKQINKGKISKEVNIEVLSLNIYSMIIQSLILWKIYGYTPSKSVDEEVDNFIEILFNGIAP
ncbi:MAG: TetR/AcrR family transcriptional regulator [Methanobrevibacter wolinii]|uniref:TetR/AcrR family transcriptional regulator n=1 Tax=Methanobrevibacter wolinii TaxID=190977 RepID=UPI0005B2CA4C|nr:helix-turn-helix domain-containing protein [Methanobrevibacter wolinii]MDD5959431.1 helix-turn-helix domain containing protein [Methanobrevibacter wolinii]